MTSSFYGFHPLIQRWFCSRFDQPTEPQARGWPAIVRGETTLIAAPTGSGKTLTAFLACIDRLLKTALQEPLTEEVKVVYVSPLRALSNDMHRNLETPLQEINALACDEHPDMTPLRAGLRTGDTSSSKRAALVRRPPHILVTTPESLYLMLTAPKARETLVNVETVIVDEIHALVRDKRGSHLALTLERLEAVSSQPLQRIGLSATQKPIEHTAAFLVGIPTDPASRERQRPESASGAPQSPDRSPEEDEQQHGSSTLNTQHSTPDSPCTIIDVGHQRKLDLAIETPESELGAVCTAEQWAEVHDKLQRLIESHHSTLIFVNTRRLAERLTHQLTELLGEDAVSSHHGSLSAPLRLKTEQRLKTGELKAVVATASLELGIDIGYIDLVVQIGSPRSIATFLQRIGRSGHSLGLVPKGRLFALTRDELLESMALMRAVRAGRLDTVPIPEAPLDVLAQQIVAEVSAQPWSCDELYALFRRAYPYRNLKREDFDRVVEILSEGIARSSGRSRVYLHHDHVNGRLRARRGARIPATSNAGAIPEVFQFRVVAEPERTVVGSLDEDFAVESLAGDVFLLGNTSWRILNVRGGDVNVADAHGAPPTIPFWRGEAPGRTFELSEEVSRLRDELEQQLRAVDVGWISNPSALENDDSTVDIRRASLEPDGSKNHPAESADLVSWLADETNCTVGAARQAVHYVAAQKAAVGVVPTQRRVIFERFFDESGGMQLVVHAPFGGRINKAWGLAMRKRFCRSFDFELQATADDDGFILSLGPQHSFPIESLFGMLTTANARALLEQAVLAVPMFELRWRWNATRSLLVLRNNAGKKVPPAIQRFRAQDLLTAVFPRLTGCQEEHTGDIPIPDHPLVQQTLEDCLTEAVDLDGLRDVLDRIERGEITLLARDTREPSPFSYELLNSNPYAFLDGGEIQERRARAVSTRRTLSIESIDDLGRLDPEAIEQIRQEAQPPLRNAEELHDRLLSRVLLPVDECPAILSPDAATLQHWFAELAGEQRAGEVTLPDGRTAWVPAERWSMATAAFPDLRSEPVLETPSTVRQEWTTAEARMAMVRGLLEVCGPIRTEDVARRLCLTESQAHSVLEALEGEGLVLRGRFTPEAAEQQRNEWQGHSAFRAGAPATVHSPECHAEARGLPFHAASPPPSGEPEASTTGAVPCEWCHRGLLARIHRLTLQGLRREIEPVGVEVYQRFLFAHHGIVEGHRRAGSNGVFEVVSLLQGLDVPAACWERDVLPLRVEQYEPRLLDELCLAGEIGWGRINPAPHNPDRSRPMASLTRAAPVSLFLRQDSRWLLADATDVDPNTLTSPARHVYEVLCQAGAMFAADLLAETRMLPGGLDDALGELVTRGVVTADGFGGLRRLIDRNGSQSSNQSGSRRRASRERQRPEPASSRKRRLLRQRTNASTIGRWSVWRGGEATSNASIAGVRPAEAVPSAEQNETNDDAAESRAETVEQWAWQLLRRWGLVFRDLLNRESCAPPWYELRQVYRRLEARGEVRGGRFLTGVSGEQFGLGETVRRLRQLRQESPGEEIVVVSAADPVNLTGIITDHPRVPSIATNRVAFLNGRPVAAWQAGDIAFLEQLTPQQQAILSGRLKQGTTTDDLNLQSTVGKRDQSQSDSAQRRSAAGRQKGDDRNGRRSRGQGKQSRSRQKRYPNDIPRPLF